MRKVRKAALGLGGLVLTVSCFRGAAPPNVAPQRTLELGREGSVVRPPKEFAVVFGGPRGETTEPSEVSIVWNRPMRPLELAGDESAPPATLTLAGGTTPKGTWRWMGTSALAFIPEARLPRATEYTVTVPAGTRALDGSTLGKPYAFTFSTPRPQVVRVTIPGDTTHVKPDATMELRMNQPVDLKEVARAVKILALVAAPPAKPGEKPKAPPPGRSIAFTATFPKADSPTLVKLTPREPLPLGTSFEIVAEASLRGTEGPLPMGSPSKTSFSTYGPLEVSDVGCSRDSGKGPCRPRGSLYVSLTNGVPLAEAKAHVRVEGVNLKWGTYDSGTSSYVGIPARLGPARSYTVVVTAGMKDIYGQVLARTSRVTLTTGDESPSATLGVRGSVFEALRPAAGRNIPVGSMNVDEYELLTGGLSEETLAKAISTDVNEDQRMDALKSAGAKVEKVRPGGPKNQYAVRTVSLDGILAGTKGRGVLALGMRSPTGWNGGTRSDLRVLTVSDLGITARMSRFGSDVWVSRLSDGSFVSDALVSVRDAAGKAVFTGKTDPSGHLAIASAAYQPVDATNGGLKVGDVLTARVGDDWTFERVSQPLDSWRFGTSTDVSGNLRPYGMLFTDRGIYKIGESIRVKGLFREPLARGTTTPVGRTVHFEATDGSGAKLLSTTGRVGPFGDFAFDVPVPESAHLGDVSLRAEVDGKEGEPSGSAYDSVTLGAYRPAEFKVAVEPDHPSYVRGDKAEFVTHGDYLFGAPMTGGGVRYTVTRGSGWFALPGADDLVYDDATYASELRNAEPRANRLGNGQGGLGAKGTFAVPVNLALPNQTGTEVVNVEAEVEDLSRQTIAAEASAIVHPAEFYVAMARPADIFQTAGTKLKTAALAIEPKGRHRPAVRLKFDLVKRSYHTVVEAGDEDAHYDSRPVDTIVTSCEAVSAETAAGCELPLAEAGYYIVRASAQDGRKNPVAASYSVYVTQEQSTFAWPVTDRAKLDLVTDKKTYEIGQTARVLVKSPFREAEALVTVERAGVYRQFRTKVTGSMPTLAIPVTEDMRPNAFVSVQLVRGRTAPPKATGPDITGPQFRLGYAEIVVNPEARRLKVGITPSKREARPGEELDVDLTVVDRAGKGTLSEVTFYAVDEGVLMLTGYKTPDPLPRFTARRSLAVVAYDTREDMASVIKLTPGPGSDKGDDGGGGGGDVRSDFRSTAHFSTVRTDAQGKARVHFKLPDGLTTYRLMAVAAAEDDRFGFAESQVVTSRPLMARPALPRFLRAGDAVDAGIIVTSKGLAAQTVDVSLEVEGLTLQGDAKQRVSVPANGSTEVRFHLAAPKVGKAKLTFHARAPGGADDVAVVRDVKVPLSPEAVALYGDTAEAVAEKLGDLRGIRGDVGGLDLRLASTALVGLDDGVEQLVEYPHGCTEQLTSRLVPLVAMQDLAAAYGITLSGDRNKSANAAIAKILEHQRPDGGFGYWADSTMSSAWLSAYALWGLSMAQSHGRTVPPEAIKNATRFVRAYLARPAAKGQQEIWIAEAAFIVDVLATVGAPDPGYTTRLLEKKKDLPLFARALLAHAVSVSKMNGADAKELMDDLEAHLRITPTGVSVVGDYGDRYVTLLDSDARTTALTLRALLAMDKNHPLAPRIAKGLLAMRKGGSWRSTQETAWALLALDDYRKAQESVAPSFDARVFLGDLLAHEAPFRGGSVKPQTVSFSTQKLLDSGAANANLAFQVQGSGRLFYEARLKYARTELPTTPLDRGFFVQKTMRSVKAEDLAEAMKTQPKLSARFASGGDLVLVDLVVVTPDPRVQVVIDDPLPAGLEAVQTDLATSARTLDVTSAGGEGDDDDDRGADRDDRANGRGYGFAWYHREFHDDRVLTFVDHMPAGAYHYRYLARATTHGTFVTPPTRAECMYEPETFGRTAATTFEVKPR